MTKPINDYNGPSKFRLGQLVQTKSGLVGKVIGYAEYRTGWEYRIKVEGKKNTMYRKQEELKVPSKKKKLSTKKSFEKGRMAYIMKYYHGKETE
jgi:hypothetical protein